MKRIPALLGSILLPLSAQAESIVLTIDITNPEAVVISATNGGALNNVTSVGAAGLLLGGVFTANASFPPLTLSGSLGTTTFPGIYSSVVSVGIEIQLNGGPLTLETMIGYPPFTGAATVNLAGYQHLFQNPGYVGTVMEGMFSDVIGSYQVIPEPTSLAFGATAIAALAIASRRQRKA